MVFDVRKYGFSWVYVCILQFVRSGVGIPSAAVGADLSCSHIHKHPRNGGGNAYLVMWKCVFGNGNMHFWLCKDTDTMNRPLRLTGCS